MFHGLDTKHRTRRRRIASTFAATLMAGAIVVAAPAVAATGSDTLSATSDGKAAWACASGDFCLYEGYYGAGARYFHDGNDGNLHNDYFRAGVTVANHASSARNNGTPAAYDDVVIYDRTWSAGRLNCIPRGYYANFGSAGSDNRVESFAWTTSC